jgi:hypothetical protein
MRDVLDVFNHHTRCAFFLFCDTGVDFDAILSYGLRHAISEGHPVLVIYNPVFVSAAQHNEDVGST